MDSRLTIPRNIATLKNDGYPLTLQTIYPNFDLVVGEAGAGVSVEEPHECLENGDELTVFSIRMRLVCTIGIGGWDTAT